MFLLVKMIGFRAQFWLVIFWENLQQNLILFTLRGQYLQFLLQMLNIHNYIFIAKCSCWTVVALMVFFLLRLTNVHDCEHMVTKNKIKNPKELRFHSYNRMLFGICWKCEKGVIIVWEMCHEVITEIKKKKIITFDYLPLKSVQLLFRMNFICIHIMWNSNMSSIHIHILCDIHMDNIFLSDVNLIL